MGSGVLGCRKKLVCVEHSWSNCCNSGAGLKPRGERIDQAVDGAISVLDLQAADSCPKPVRSRALAVAKAVRSRVRLRWVSASGVLLTSLFFVLLRCVLFFSCFIFFPPSPLLIPWYYIFPFRSFSLPAVSSDLGSIDRAHLISPFPPHYPRQVPYFFSSQKKNSFFSAFVDYYGRP